MFLWNILKTYIYLTSSGRLGGLTLKTGFKKSVVFRCLKLYALKNAHNWLVTPAFRASQVALVVKNLPASAGDVRDSGLIPGLGRSPGGGNGNPLQYSCLENPMDRGAWQATVHRVAKSRTWMKRLSTHACLHLTTFQNRNLLVAKSWLALKFSCLKSSHETLELVVCSDSILFGKKIDHHLLWTSKIRSVF